MPAMNRARRKATVRRRILMDYNDIIVHIFSEEDRLFYDLERIWRDGKSVDIDEFKMSTVKSISVYMNLFQNYTFAGDVCPE